MSTPDRLRQRLVAGLAALHLDLPVAAVERLLAYVELLARWNAAYNLSAVREVDAMVTRHLLDSLAALPYVRGGTLADLGSGAGLPGIPFAIAAPRLEVTLVDSNGKKTRFLRAAARELELGNVRVVESRVEAVDGTYECVSARAFASLAEMLNWGGRLLAPDGTWLALKGRFPEEELAAVPAGFRVEKVDALAVPGLDAERHVVVIKRARPDAPGDGEPSLDGLPGGPRTDRAQIDGASHRSAEQVARRCRDRASREKAGQPFPTSWQGSSA